MLKIDNQKCAILGLQGSGKTYFAKQIVKENNYNVLVYSPHIDDFKDEPDNFIFYKYKDFYNDFERFIEHVIELGKKKEINGVLIDEFDMLFKGNADMKRMFTDLIVNHRHYNLFVIGISRRGQDIPAKFLESCKYVISFALQGGNVRKKFNDLKDGFGDSILSLDYDRHEYIINELGKPLKRIKP